LEWIRYGRPKETLPDVWIAIAFSGTRYVICTPDEDGHDLFDAVLRTAGGYVIAYVGDVYDQYASLEVAKEACQYHFEHEVESMLEEA